QEYPWRPGGCYRVDCGYGQPVWRGLSEPALAAAFVVLAQVVVCLAAAHALRQCAATGAGPGRWFALVGVVGDQAVPDRGDRLLSDVADGLGDAVAAGDVAGLTDRHHAGGDVTQVRPDARGTGLLVIEAVVQQGEHERVVGVDVQT